MHSEKIRKFMELAGHLRETPISKASEEQRKLGAQLLLSEVLEYVVHGLGIVPEVNGVKIEKPDEVNYLGGLREPEEVEMLDGLSDVAYTMYWNSEAFGLPLEEAFDRVCDNNLQKFVKLKNWSGGEQVLTADRWDCGLDVKWPPEVVKVEVLKVNGDCYAVGKDRKGKVRKPSTFKPVDLAPLLEKAAENCCSCK